MIQLALLEATHGQVEAVAVTATLPVAPAEVTGDCQERCEGSKRSHSALP